MLYPLIVQLLSEHLCAIHLDGTHAQRGDNAHEVSVNKNCAFLSVVSCLLGAGRMMTLDGVLDAVGFAVVAAVADGVDTEYPRRGAVCTL